MQEANPLLTNLKLDKVQLSNFQNFSELKDVAFSPAINLIIGENDSGKTGLLKLLYSVSKSWEIYSRRSGYDAPHFKTVLGEKIFDTFQPRDSRKIGELVSKSTRLPLQFKAQFTGNQDSKHEIAFQFGEYTTKTINECSEKLSLLERSCNSLFIPAKEVLTAFKAIKFTRDPHYLAGFDDTYIDLIDSLYVATRRLNENPSEALTKVNQEIETLFGGKIIQTDAKDEPFVFQKGKNKFAISLTAEGIKRIGILTTLIQNWELSKGSILYIDELEANLHPKAIRKIVELLVKIAEAGVQIFLSSHSYFVVSQLEISARKTATPIFCHSLLAQENGLTEIQTSNLKNGMPDNPIIDEALAMFNEDVQLDLEL